MMADNVPMPKNYRRRHDLMVTQADKIVSELTEKFGGDEVVFLGSREEGAIKEVLGQLQFYKRRCDEICKVQPTFRDPERQIIVEILANGYSMRANKSTPAR